MDSDLIILISLSLLFSAFFSGLEIAFISSDRLFIELQAKKGGKRDKILARFKNNPEMFIATMLVGNTLILTLYGSYMAELLDSILYDVLVDYIAFAYMDAAKMFLQTIISTIIVLATAEFLPKSLFLIDPYKVLRVLVYPMMIVYYPFYPFVWIIVRLSRFFIVKILKQEYSGENAVFGLTDLNNYLKNIVSKNIVKEENVEVDTEMFTNALEFQTVQLRDCMIPRTEIIAVEVNQSISELKETFVETGYSKILVYSENIDNIIGYVYHSKLFKKPKNIKEIVSKLVIAPETMLANDLMVEFSKKRKSIALIVDEYGGTAGMVTMEDVIEEIFGDIQDEHDDDDLVEQKVSENEWLLSARHEIDYLNEHLEIGVPEGEYDTLGGFILNCHGDIPNVFDKIIVDNFTFVIKSMQSTRIDKVSLLINNTEEKLD